MKVKWKHPRKLAKSGSMLDRQAVKDQLFKSRSGSVQKSPLPYCCRWVEAEIYVIFLPLHVLKCAQQRIYVEVLWMALLLQLSNWGLTSTTCWSADVSNSGLWAEADSSHSEEETKLMYFKELSPSLLLYCNYRTESPLWCTDIDLWITTTCWSADATLGFGRGEDETNLLQSIVFKSCILLRLQNKKFPPLWCGVQGHRLGGNNHLLISWCNSGVRERRRLRTFMHRVPKKSGILNYSMRFSISKPILTFHLQIHVCK